MTIYNPFDNKNNTEIVNNANNPAFFASDTLAEIGIKARPEYPPCPAENLQAVIRGVFDVGMEYSEIHQKWADKIMVIFEVDEAMPAGCDDFTGKRYNINYSLTKKISDINSNYPLSNLTKLILACIGEIPANFKLSDLVGLNCNVEIIHKVASNGKVYANINNVSKKAKGLPLLEIEIPYNETPKWIVEKKERNDIAYKSYLEKINQLKSQVKSVINPNVDIPQEIKGDTIDLLLDQEMPIKGEV